MVQYTPREINGFYMHKNVLVLERANDLILADLTGDARSFPAARNPCLGAAQIFSQMAFE